MRVAADFDVIDHLVNSGGVGDIQQFGSNVVAVTFIEQPGGAGSASKAGFGRMRSRRL